MLLNLTNHSNTSENTSFMNETWDCTGVTSNHSNENTSFMAQKIVFFCEGCDKSFATLWSLNRHQKIHSCDRKKFTCYTCKVKCTSWDNLRRHSKKAHDRDTKTDRQLISDMIKTLELHDIAIPNRLLRGNNSKR